MTQFKDITYEEIDLIKALWEKNRQYHEWTSEHFGYKYKGLEFRDRIQAFKDLDPTQLKITIAVEEKSVVAYCLSLQDKGIGELATLHVLHDQRRKGIGKRLVDVHLDWLKESSSKEIKVTVSQENSQTISFYKELGFYPNALEMIYKKE